MNPSKFYQFMFSDSTLSSSVGSLNLEEVADARKTLFSFIKILEHLFLLI